MQFVCRYGTPDGHVLTEVEVGSDAESVRRELERKGFYIFEVRPRGVPFKLALPWRRKKIPDDQFLAFNQEMAALLRAGLPLIQALELMLERMENEKLRSVLVEIHDRVSSGEELSEAFANFGELFPPLYPATLKAGERSGELEQVIRRFIRYQRLVLSARKRVTSALVYPAVLICLSIAMLTLMSVYVVPNFTKFYADLDAELPAMTQVTLAVSFWLRRNFLYVILGVIATYMGFRIYKETPDGRRTFDRWRLQIPALGSIFHQFSLSEFCRSLSTLLSGGIPLVNAFEISAGAISNSHISATVKPAIGRVREGQAFHQALDETGVFPHIAVDMIKVGEATGSLDEMLSSVSDYFDDRVETRMQRLLSLVEPMLLIIMGILIGFILISVYLPMFTAFSQVG